MVDAFGVYGTEGTPELIRSKLLRSISDVCAGPFRKSCELTLGILRQNEDTLMTILETFVYDPTTDFIGRKRKVTSSDANTPQEVLDVVRGKVSGLLRGEAVPLSIEGHVQELIQQATSLKNLAAMYVGWCAFL